MSTGEIVCHMYEIISFTYEIISRHNEVISCYKVLLSISLKRLIFSPLSRDYELSSRYDNLYITYIR